MFNSSYRLKITGHNPRGFLSKLITLGLELIEVNVEKNNLIILVDEKTYQKIVDLKTIYKIEIINRYGLARYKYLFQKYIIFLLSIAFSLILIKALSCFILKIEVIHTKQEIRELIITDLEEYGIKPYHFKVSFSKKEQIAEKILEKEKDRLEWMEIEEVGTTYRINVEERKKNNAKINKEEQSIIAKKSGRILEIHASHGEILKKKNDYVQKGDVIISGIIKNKETPVSKIRAEGTVFAEIWYQVQVEVPYHYKEEIKTGKKKSRFEIEFLNHSYTLFDFSPYEISTKERRKLLKSNLLPISFSYTTFHEIKVKEEIHNAKDAYQKAQELAKKKLKAKLGKEDTIISQKTLKKSHKNSKIVVDIFFKVKENITDTENLKNIKLEELQEKAKAKEGE